MNLGWERVMLFWLGMGSSGYTSDDMITIIRKLFWYNILHGLRPTGQPRLQSQGPLWYDWYIYDHGTALIKYIINIRGLISFNQTIPLVKMESSSNIFQRPGVQMHGWQTTILTITIIIRPGMQMEGIWISLWWYDHWSVSIPSLLPTISVIETLWFSSRFFLFFQE